MLIGYVLAVISLLFGFVCIRICRKFLNPGTLFCFIWGTIFFLSSLRLFDLNPSENITFIRLGVGVLCFIVGYLGYFTLGRKLKFTAGRLKLTQRQQLGFQKVYIPEYKYMILYFIVTYMIIERIPRAFSNIFVLIGGSNLTDILFSVRKTSANMRGTIQNVIKNLITSPTVYAVYPICAYNMIYKKKKSLTVLVIALIILGIFTSGGRSLLIYFGIALLCTYIFSEEDAAIRIKLRKFLRKRKKTFKWIMAGGILFFIFISYLRSGQTLLKDSYYYFAMQPTMFEQWSEIVDEKGIYGFGIASFNGFSFPPLYIITNILQIDYPKEWNAVYNLILQTDSVWKHITTTGITANAYVSNFWFYYLDGRIFGIIFISFFYGIMCSRYYIKAVENPNMKNICIYSMILFSVFDTYVRMRFTLEDFVLGYLILHFLLFKKAIW